MENDEKNMNNNPSEEEIVGKEESKDAIEALTQEEISNVADDTHDLKDQIEILQDKLLRTMAESENTRRRFEKTVEETRDYCIVNVAKDLLGVMDNLSRALEHKPTNVDSQTASVIAGVEMTRQELQSVFKKHGLEAIEPQVGEKFDYNLHHAVAQIVTDEYNQDSIISVMQSGYKIKERLLRPAIVTVSKKS